MASDLSSEGPIYKRYKYPNGAWIILWGISYICNAPWACPATGLDSA